MGFVQVRIMDQSHIKRKLVLTLSLCFLGIIILSFTVIPYHNFIFAASDFTIEAKINLQKLNDPAKMKVVASANGDTQVKNVTGNDLKSKSTTVSFKFNQKNDVVKVGDRDEFFVCAYDLNAQTNEMKSYSCVEGNIGSTGGKNIVNIGSGSEKTLSTGNFQSSNGGENSTINNPTLQIAIPLSDRKDVKELKVVTMIRGEFNTKTIDAERLLKEADHSTLIIPFVFDKVPEIGPIQKGDLFFACVSGDELNPPEGTECEHRHTVHTGHIHNLVVR
ncbi:MAG TPA: hypothetical protein VE594_02655 [Nitrososphaeraceae archaeon]|nr:hypothetical protein [Nitrososphaeraceae archaeon]